MLVDARSCPVILFALAAALAGCDSDDPSSDPVTTDVRTHVGTVDGIDAWIATVVDGDIVTAFVCGGEQTVDTHTRWFQGTLAEGDEYFQLEREGAVLHGRLVDAGLEGEFEIDGDVLSFAAIPADEAGDPGLYRTEHEGEVAGVIVREGDQDGVLVQGAACDSLLKCAQVIILAPVVEDGSIVADFDGTAVTVPRF